MEFWDTQEDFSVFETICLWCGFKPQTDDKQFPQEWQTAYEFIVGQIKARELKSYVARRQYLAEDWITIRQLATDTNRSRWPIVEFWQEVQGAFPNFGEATGILTKRRIHEAMLEHLLPQAAGLMTSVIALSDDGTPDSFVPLAKAYLHGRGTTLEEVIERKRKRRGKG